MPRLSHEALVQLVRNAPAIVPGLLWPGEARGAAQVHVTAAEFVDLNFAEHRADVVLALGEEPARPDEVLVVEVQVEPDPRKRRSWPLYVAGLGARMGCPVLLVVVTLDRDVARWCAEPIDLGRGRFVLRPWVLGPETVPVITDLEAARRAPELAVLSVGAHADEPGAERIARAALEAARELDGERRIVYPDFVLALLGRVAPAVLEKIMPLPSNWVPESEYFRNILAQAKAQAQAEGRAEGMAEGRAEGRAEGEVLGEAKMLLKLLQLKGFALTEVQRERVMACRDTALLEAWAERVLGAQSLDAVFAD